MPFNIIVRGFEDPLGTRALTRAFEGISIGTCYIMGRNEKDAAKVPAKNRIFWGPSALDHVDWNALRPLDEELIEKMRPCEAVTFEMFTRLETDGRFLSYGYRKREYLRLLRYWNDLLERDQIRMFLSYTVPHFPPDYVLYHLCKLKGIPTILCSPGDPLQDVLFLHDDLEEPALALRERVAAPRPQSAPLPPHLESYFQRQTDDRSPEHTRKPWYHQMAFPKLPWSRSPLKRGFLQRQFRYISRLLQARKTFTFYDANATSPDFSRRFIYVALHMQPECNTTPLAGAYANQELIVQMLGALVPEDVLIYVKEHPFQKFHHPDGKWRSIAFYSDLLKVRNVRFMPRDLSTYTLIEHCSAVVSASSTAGFEALFRGKPAIVFGHRFHCEAPGVFRVRTIDDCKEALSAIFEKGVHPTREDMRFFLHAVEETAVYGYTDLVYRMATTLTDEQSAEQVGKALREKIRSAKPHTQFATVSR